MNVNMFVLGFLMINIYLFMLLLDFGDNSYFRIWCCGVKDVVGWLDVKVLGWWIMFFIYC